MAECKPIATPMATKQAIFAIGDAPFHDAIEYRRIVGALQYLTLTRPDLCFAVNTVCQHKHTPTNTHFQMVKRVLSYVKGTLSIGLCILKHSSQYLHASLMPTGLAVQLLDVLPPVIAPS